jgi:hypothetical protein
MTSESRSVAGTPTGVVGRRVEPLRGSPALQPPDDRPLMDTRMDTLGTLSELRRDDLRAACFAAAGQLDSGASIESVAAYLNQKVEDATRLSKTNPDAYDGSKYRYVGFFECDCGFKVRSGAVDEAGRYSGSRAMIEHLEVEHGYVRRTRKAAAR